MTQTTDSPARSRALTDLSSTLVVEAAAGTGKTSLLAGRIAMLLAEGAPPASIAAITFTKLAADELSSRVRETIDLLLAGSMPESLKAVLPNGLSVDQRLAMATAVADFDALTTCTIHGFCQILIRDYAVEAEIDPGAQVLDRDGELLAFDQVFDAWLSRRLGADARADDPIAVLARSDPRKSTKTLRELARFRLKHRRATAPVADLEGRPDLTFTETVDVFRRAVNSAAPHDGNSKMLEHLEALDRHFAGNFAVAPNFVSLWRMAHPPSLACMRKETFDVMRPRHFGPAGSPASVDLAPVVAGFEAADAAYRLILSKVSAGVIAVLSAELDELLAEYRTFKRRAALLDFDDLLERASRMLRDHEQVRQALSQRYRHLLVDEFQDTDPAQCDIIFRIAAQASAEEWTDLAPRAGALFLVGDPKQAIFQFRGAHVTNYENAKAVVARAWPDNILSIVANFRSRSGIITYVNDTFGAAMNGQLLQPGYVDLEATRRDDPARPSATKLALAAPHDAKREELQAGEAEAVAEVCTRLVGSPLLRDAEGNVRKVTPRDIALLAPTNNSLWTYERALQAAGLPIASQAGKGLFRRQEIQDIVALVRVLADGRDTAAFGALMRGPLVGLTDQALLDITAALPKRDGRPGVFSVTTPPEQIEDLTTRDVVCQLEALRRRARFTSPAQLLGEAIERLGVRVAISLRNPRHASAALANIDLILDRASRYGIRGLRRLAADLNADWAANLRAQEGAGDVDGQAVSIVSMHSAKGLEWPVVIPINAMVQLYPPERFVHRSSDETLHWLVGEVAGPDLAEAVRDDTASQLREKARLWYVACTRARDFLILPHHANVSPRAWSRVLDLRAQTLPEFDPRRFSGGGFDLLTEIENQQDPAVFAAEAAVVASASPPITWLRPSDHDTDRAEAVEVIAESLDEEDDEGWTASGGRLRGLVLHKLIEEILEEGLGEDANVLAARARVLAAQLLPPGEADESLEDVAELAATVLRTLALPEIAELRPRLRAELPIYAQIGPEGDAQPMAGRADAVALDGAGAVDVVLDWKSDVAPGPQQMADHVEQLRLYLAATGAPRGALVYMSLGRVRWVALAAA